MQRDFTNPGYIILYFLVLLSLTATFQNALKHDKNGTKLHIKRPNTVFSWGSAPESQTPWGAYDAPLPRPSTRLGGLDKLLLLSPLDTSSVPCLKNKKAVLSQR